MTLAIKQFDKQTLGAFRVALDNYLSKFECNGVKLTTGNIKYEPGEAKITLTARIDGVKTFATSILERKAKELGLSLEVINGKQLIDYRPRQHKYPYIYKDLLRGKTFKSSEANTVFTFGNPAAQAAATAAVRAWKV